MRTHGAVVDLLGRPAARALRAGDVEAAIARVTPRTFKTFKDVFQLDRKRMSRVLCVGERTVDRMLRPGYKVPEDVADRMLRIARILREAEDALEGRESAVRWLTSEVPALGRRVPLEMMRTDLGAKLVEDELVRLKHGMYS
ncbi:MAG: DUF2384 domain-containing protein [Deltaproteobacteria bacterium]|nr:DUF2384 domain-containing protein [Deltaproteobacteria bacterium]